MDKLIQFLNAMPPPEQAAFAARCGTSVGYLRKAASKKQRLGDGLCINIERESGRRVRCEDLRVDIDWAYLRGTSVEGVVAPESAGTAAVPANSATPERRDPRHTNAFPDLDRRAVQPSPVVRGE